VGINATYSVADSGVTTVIEKVSITNREDYYYAPSYTVNLGLDNISNISARNSSGRINTTIKKTDDGTDIELTFPERIVGKGVTNNFTFQFDSTDIARKKGNIWEIDIPGIANSAKYQNYNVEVVVPPSFGIPTIVKPVVPLSQTNTYRFTKEQIGDGGVFMTFGQSQYFDVRLSYHLSNPNLFPIKTEIALPPNTSYQTVLINSLQPKPTNVYQDSDGNWLAEYSLSPSSELNISAQTQIQIMDKPSQSQPLQPNQYTQKADYWNVDDPKIQELATKYKTPEQIYKYVVDNLKYNYNKSGDKNVRLGATKSLQTPDNAVCLEFTDLFVTMARAAGIPARAVEGYAYTDNSKLRPLSLDSDVLHAWPEYYDSEKQTWIMVDPTWGNTTGGIDYFNTLDFDHIAFVIKGKSSVYPIPAGGYKTEKKGKDITVRFIPPASFQVKPSISLTHTFPESTLPGFPIRAAISIQNDGNTLVPATFLAVKNNTTSKETQYKIHAIPPFGKETLTISTERLPFLTNKPYSFTISYAGESFNQNISASFIPHDYIYIIGGVFLVAGCITIAFAIKAWRLHIQKQ
jgi:transglutaminase-like putative cysteine protease